MANTWQQALVDMSGGTAPTWQQAVIGTANANTGVLTVGAEGAMYTTVQAAVDAAVASGLYSWSNLCTIEYGPNVDPTVNRDAYTGKILTTGNAACPGIVLKPSVPIADEARPIVTSAISLAVNVDDGKNTWTDEEPGYDISTGEATTGWADAGSGIGISASSTVYAMGTKSLRLDVNTTVGTIAYIPKTVTTNDYNTLSFWVYSTAARAAGNLIMGFSTSATFADDGGATVVNLPKIIGDGWQRIVLDISGININAQSFGIRTAGNYTGMSLFIDNIKMHVLGVPSIYIPGTGGDGTTLPAKWASDYRLASLTPQGYAALNGIPMTHCVSGSYLGTSTYMGGQRIREVLHRYGGEIASHGLSHTAAPTTQAGVLDYTLGFKETLESLTDATGATYWTYPTNIGLLVRGIKESGAWSNATTYTVNSLVRTKDRLAQAYKTWFKWSMNYLGTALPSNRWFGTNSWNEDQISDLGTTAPDNPGVIQLHFIADAHADYTASYVQFRAFCIGLHTAIVANDVVCLTLSSYFDTLRSEPLIANPGTQTNDWPYIVGQASLMTLTGIGVAGSQDAGSIKGILGTDASAAVGTLNLSVIGWTPGMTTGLRFVATSNNTGVLPLNLSVVYSGKDSAGSAIATTSIPLYGVKPTDSGTDTYFVFLNPPLWATSIIVSFTKPAMPSGVNGTITLDDFRQMVRA